MGSLAPRESGAPWGCPGPRSSTRSNGRVGGLAGGSCRTPGHPDTHRGSVGHTHELTLTSHPSSSPSALQPPKPATHRETPLNTSVPACTHTPARPTPPKTLPLPHPTYPPDSHTREPPAAPCQTLPPAMFPQTVAPQPVPSPPVSPRSPPVQHRGQIPAPLPSRGSPAPIKRGARSGASCGRRGASGAPESGETRTGTGTATATPGSPGTRRGIPSSGAPCPGGRRVLSRGRGVSPRGGSQVLEGPVPAAEGVSCPGGVPSREKGCRVPGWGIPARGGPIPRRVLSQGRGVGLPSARVGTPSRGASSPGNFIPWEGVPNGVKPLE
ncbi:translation initiation factor IF-2-like [Motacilla alba alba]|uniref:translation initiation factor IF-2-like n=1 Tax=Motacilla alba alba TaxID=1094192 RepID=UPI0018D54411|nr:translation initiation factor IF-2-like [Motacilla alba alba]XP_038015345.1 translation initiation factor IF-2-like [Motacilla alba alba]XP_038015346.1 translation initiation factor IF-2-like [Motacilla alba alba]XP_038015347.1 translation initiation factor IF-2-like [Motacilla alba alba]